MILSSFEKTNLECAQFFGNLVRAGDFAMEAGHQEAFDVLLDAGEFAASFLVSL